MRTVEVIFDTALRTLIVDDDVHEREKIRTSNLSATRIAFADETDFLIGPNTEIILDKFVFDPNPGKGKLFLSLGRGLMKFKTGVMPSAAYKVQTRVATIGVRGTEFAVKVLANGTTMVYVIRGKVVISDNKGRMVEVLPNESAIVYPDHFPEAADGPVHFPTTSEDFIDEVRRLTAMIVFNEDTKLEQFAAQYKIPGPIYLKNVLFDGIPQIALGWHAPGGPRYGGQRPAAAGAAGGQGYGGANNDPAIPTLHDLGWFDENPPPPNPTATGNTNPPPGPAGPGPSGGTPPSGGPTPSFDGYLTNGNFESGTTGWQSAGAGTFAVVADNANDPDTNHTAVLTTGSPVSITAQLTTTPDTIFIVQWQASFLDGDGVLDVLLNGISLGTIFATESDALNLLQVTVDDERFGGLTDAELSFLFDAAAANKRLHLDNIIILATDQPFSQAPAPMLVPAPGSLWMLVVGIATISRLRAGRARKNGQGLMVRWYAIGSRQRKIHLPPHVPAMAVRELAGGPVLPEAAGLSV